MRKIFTYAKRAAVAAADFGLLLVTLAVVTIENHISDPFKTPKY